MIEPEIDLSMAERRGHQAVDEAPGDGEREVQRDCHRHHRRRRAAERVLAIEQGADDLQRVPTGSCGAAA